MPASYLSKHRPICAVLAEIREITTYKENVHPAARDKIVSLVDEAITYARSMSNKLVEYKQLQDIHDEFKRIHDEFMAINHPNE